MVLLVVDENSMVDLMLMQALLKAALLIVGSGAVPVRLVRLAEVFRQTAIGSVEMIDGALGCAESSISPRMCPTHCGCARAS